MPFAGLLRATWLELFSWPINKEVFQDELAFPAIQWTTTVVALDLSICCRRISFGPNQLVLRIALWANE
jgi:hypothetical protein